ncbi:hypothetical protein LC613_00995 [Nostoc sphaeroides CHAB 2801]|uniref:hypothetical protein n=1 Tax=Nostoc sphaeroides TaxID=446679 RepID=UPI0015F3430F|nr:hypothetical protein [Nostoc sphaeroides]MCC5626841.1 hypothetical protein [Nostoc sphaeroides CHAB 2801]
MQINWAAAASKVGGSSPMRGIPQYGSVKPKDAINRRLYKGLLIVETAIYRVFVI